jgi:hypothetical protein
MVMLNAAESFFLGRSYDLTVDDQTRGRIMIKRRYAQYAYQLIESTCFTLEQRVDEWRDGRTLGENQ